MWSSTMKLPQATPKTRQHLFPSQLVDAVGTEYRQQAGRDGYIVEDCSGFQMRLATPPCSSRDLVRRPAARDRAGIFVCCPPASYQIGHVAHGDSRLACHYAPDRKQVAMVPIMHEVPSPAPGSWRTDLVRLAGANAGTPGWSVVWSAPLFHPGAALP